MAVSKGFMHHLSLAACEWFLMLLMFIDAALAFVLTKFAQHCELQTPCLFCLRLDHIFGNEKPGSYLSLFCSKHRAEISSLITCDLHHKLADVGEMCDDCFMSNQSNRGSYRIVEGKMGIKGYQNLVRVPSGTGTCSCCKRQWKSKPSAQRLLQPGPVRLRASKVTMKPPLPRVAVRSRFHHRNNFKRVRNKISGTSTPCHVGNNMGVDVGALSDSGCAELRFNSDSESEVPFSSDNDVSLKVAVIGKKRGSKDDSPVIQGTSSENQDQTQAEHSQSVSDPGPSLPDGNHNESITSPASLTSNGSIGHELEELNRMELQARAVSVSSVPQDMDSTPVQSKLSADDVKENGPPEVRKDTRSLPSRGSIQDMRSSTKIESGTSSQNQDQTQAEHSQGVSDPGPSLLVGQHNESIASPASLTSNGSIGDGLGELNRTELQARAVSVPSVPQDMDSTPDHSKLSADDVKENGPPEVRKDPGPSLLDGKYNESITSPASLTSNGSIGHGLGELNHTELQARAVSVPSVPQDMDSTPDQSKLPGDDVKENGPPEVRKDTRPSPSRGSIQDMHSSTNIESDLSKPDGINDCEASTSSDKNDGYESPGASSVSEIEGESVVDKLKRQVEYDWKRLQLLQTELEEERNAAAIAADEAMAMITRLQEEKASLHMEALQYLRMMEEQSEYDMDALDKANDLVAEKDKEIQDLEAELEYYRSRYDDELIMGNAMVETENFEDHMENGKTDVNSSSDSKSMKVLEARAKPVSVNTPIFDLEDEKKYILQSLSELERKFHQFPSQHTSIGRSNGNIHDENSLSRHKDSSTSNGSPSTTEENRIHVDSSKKMFFADGDEVDLGTLENEISDLNERLEALEADRDFLEHACNTLQSSGGLEFIQEIAHHLQDLRRISFDRRCLSVT